MPGLICSMLDDTIVQKAPTVPSYCEHSFVTWSAPVRTVDCPLLSCAELALAAIPATAIVTSRIRLRFMTLLHVQDPCGRRGAPPQPRSARTARRLFRSRLGRHPRS